jgi:hypothetical protein
VRFGRTAFAFLENCRAHLHVWHTTLKSKYQVTENEIRILGGTEEQITTIKYAMFDSQGYLQCYKSGTLTFYAEVPCMSWFHAHFSFTDEMCRQEVNYVNCTKFYNNLQYPESITSLECGIGTICYSPFETEFAMPTDCTAHMNTYSIDPQQFTNDGKYDSPTLLQYLRQRKRGKAIRPALASVKVTESFDDGLLFGRK